VTCEDPNSITCPGDIHLKPQWRSMATCTSGMFQAAPGPHLHKDERYWLFFLLMLRVVFFLERLCLCKRWREVAVYLLACFSPQLEACLIGRILSSKPLHTHYSKRSEKLLAEAPACFISTATVFFLTSLPVKSSPRSHGLQVRNDRLRLARPSY